MLICKKNKFKKLIIWSKKKKKRGRKQAYWDRKRICTYETYKVHGRGNNLIQAHDRN